MNFTALGTLGGVALAIASVISVLLAARARRSDRRSHELHELRDTNVALFRWRYRVERLAAQRGWDLDPNWPEVPLEVTTEYLKGKAAGTDNREVTELLQMAQQFVREIKDREPPPRDRAMP